MQLSKAERVWWFLFTRRFNFIKKYKTIKNSNVDELCVLYCCCHINNTCLKDETHFWWEQILCFVFHLKLMAKKCRTCWICSVSLWQSIRRFKLLLLSFQVREKKKVKKVNDDESQWLRSVFFDIVSELLEDWTRIPRFTIMSWVLL